MTRLSNVLVGRSEPLVIPGAHDALSARLIEDAGFEMVGIGGAGLSATQLGLPDIGAQSFGEYRDAIRRIREATRLPMMVDGENGFGDAKAVARTVRAFDDLGATALALEDLSFPPRLDRPPSVIPQDEMVAKLASALRCRASDGIGLIARTDAAYCLGPDEAIIRAKAYQAAGADAILAVGMPDAASLRALRGAVSVPLIVLSVAGSPWYAPTVAEAGEIGADAIIFPATVMLHMAAGITAGIAAIRAGTGAPPADFSFGQLASTLKVDQWRELDVATD